MLSYAAFEFRLAIERLAVHYWAELLSRPLEEKEVRDLPSFKRIENRIYELGGHQKEIDGHFEFMRVLLRLLKIDRPVEQTTHLTGWPRIEIGLHTLQNLYSSVRSPRSELTRGKLRSLT